MPLRLYNTLTQEVQPFAPLNDNTVRMYTCGPTVYDFAHIGNFRTFVFFDLLRRWLRASGFKLDHVMMKLAGTDQTSTQMPSFCGGSVKEKSIGIVKETDKDAPARRVEIWFVPSTAADPAGVSGATAVDAKAVAKLGCPK